MAALTLDSISRSFDEHFLPYVTTLRQRQQGRKFANESYVSFVKFFEGSAGVVLVYGGVYRSQRRNEDVHKVDLSVKEDKIVDAFCSCTAGISGECAHVLAVVYKITDWILEGLHDVPVQPACTSMPQQWDRPRGRKILSEPVSTMVIAKPGNMNRKKRPLVADFTDNRKIQLLKSDVDHLNSLTGSPISYLASYPDQTVTTDHGIQNLGSALAYQLPLTEPIEGPSGQIIPCSDLVYPKHPGVFIDTRVDEDWSAVALSQDAAVSLELNTRQQSNCSLWIKERNKRITSSNFGRFMIRKVAVTQKFVDSVQKQKPFTSVATSYGSSSEKVARNMYRKQTGNHVHECGFVVNPAFPFIGASPDGKVCDQSGGGILEIKCPFSIRDMTILEGLDAKRDVSQFHLELVGETIKLKRSHSYFFQVQGQLLVTGAQFCDFVTFTRCDLLIERILPDKDVFNQILEKFRTVCTKFNCIQIN